VDPGYQEFKVGIRELIYAAANWVATCTTLSLVGTKLGYLNGMTLCISLTCFQGARSLSTSTPMHTTHSFVVKHSPSVFHDSNSLQSLGLSDNSYDQTDIAKVCMYHHQKIPLSFCHHTISCIVMVETPLPYAFASLGPLYTMSMHKEQDGHAMHTYTACMQDILVWKWYTL